jgi:dTDP-4-dehydrorhamnose 3,5-epimerase
VTDPTPVVEPSALAGVRYGRLTTFADSRGSFTEIWRASAFGELRERDAGLPDARFVQANLSRSAKGVLRGLHYHRRQLDYWTVASGKAFVALVDVRPVLADAAGRAIVETRVLEAGENVTIPAGVAHGFLALEPLELLYLVTNEYDGTDELGFAWDDQAVAVAGRPADPLRPRLDESDVAGARGAAAGLARPGPVRLATNPPATDAGWRYSAVSAVAARGPAGAGPVRAARALDSPASISSPACAPRARAPGTRRCRVDPSPIRAVRCRLERRTHDHSHRQISQSRRIEMSDDPRAGGTNEGQGRARRRSTKKGSQSAASERAVEVVAPEAAIALPDSGPEASAGQAATQPHHVEASQVSITQGGAGEVEADSVSVTQGGIGAASAEDITVQLGGIGHAQADDIAVKMGAVGIARAERISIEMGGVGLVIGGGVAIRQGGTRSILARDVHLEQGGAGTVVANNVTFGSQSGAFIVVARHVQGQVRSVLDWRGGVAFGVAAGLTIGVVSLLAKGRSVGGRRK